MYFSTFIRIEGTLICTLIYNSLIALQHSTCSMDPQVQHKANSSNWVHMFLGPLHQASLFSVDIY